MRKGEGKTYKWLLSHAAYQGDDCLPWPFAKDNRTGRGLLTYKGRGYWAHRFMCELVYGPSPDDKPQAAHSCGNGHLGCINPRHLSWSDNSGNQLHRYAGETNCNRVGNRPRFTPDELALLRSRRAEFTQVQLAEMYGLSLGGIQYYLKYRQERGHETAVTNGE